MTLDTLKDLGTHTGRCSAVTQTRPEVSSVEQAKGSHPRALKDEVANTGGAPGQGKARNSGGAKQAGGRGEQHCRGPTIVSPT